ncbi:OmpA family protein [Ruegeria atlantica]|uniref:Outer membrane porin F n=1 Tax=Ruegeria atlantica TaxID=81569 RepID=A0A0P1EFB6_9RHOB|nr:OmpA family protein [Ruegeria atlantica]CUH48771.1 Outer membrane porin F precursor [Ruegeria atlantica]
MTRMISKIGALTLLVAFISGGAIAQSLYDQKLARPIGELTDKAIVEALREDGRVSMSGGFFETDSAELTGASSDVLAKVAFGMVQLPELRLVIVGHTDSVGDFYYNIDLAQRRANAVRDALLAEPNNVEPERLVAMGAGPIAPVASNLSDEGRALNRRVEFIMLDEALLVKK